MSLADELKKLDDLRQRGALNDDEYALAKAKILDEPAPSIRPLATSFMDALPRISISNDARQWAMYLHLSALAGYIPIAPGIGFILPILIWQLKKDDIPELEEHGKNVVNWLLSALIYGVVGILLAFVFVGFPLLLALFVCSIVFPIKAAIKANNGEVWKYPLAITFLR